MATALEYQLHLVSEILVGTLMYPAGRIPELLQAYVKFTGTAPDEMAATAMILPSEQRPRIRMLVGYSGPATLGNDLLKPLRAPVKPQEDTVKVMSYLEAQARAFPVSPKPSAYFVTNLFLPELNEAAVAAITTATQDAPQRFRLMIGQYHGAMTRVRPTDMGFP